MMGRGIDWGLGSILCLIAIVLSIIELGLTAYLVNVTDGTSATRNFFLFESIWTLLLSVAALLSPGRLFDRFSSRNVPLLLVLEAITTIFWFASSVAFAAQWGAPHCGNSTFCGSTEAAIAFGFILFIVYSALMFFEFRGSRGRGSGSGSAGSRTNPSVV